MDQSAKDELAQFILDNLDELNDAMNKEYAEAFPRAYGLAQDMEAINTQTKVQFIALAECLRTGDLSHFRYDITLGDCLFDPMDHELTMFASYLSALMCFGRACVPVIAEKSIIDRWKAAELLACFEEFIQDLAVYACRQYCDVITHPRALLSKWDTVSRLRRRIPNDASYAKRFLDEKNFVRIAAKNLDMPQANEPLTNRENTVLQLVLEGKSNAEIASALHVSVSTIKHQISSIFSKYDVENRAELIVKAKTMGADL